MGEAPRPKSPPKYPDLCGRRRLQLEVQTLNREVGFLERVGVGERIPGKVDVESSLVSGSGNGEEFVARPEARQAPPSLRTPCRAQELQGLERMQPVSRCCKDLNEYVDVKTDPLIPINKRKHRSCRLYRWIRSKLCTCLSCLCCWSRCLPKRPSCFSSSCCSCGDTSCCAPSCSCLNKTPSCCKPQCPDCCSLPSCCDCKPHCTGCCGDCHCQPHCCSASDCCCKPGCSCSLPGCCCSLSSGSCCGCAENCSCTPCSGCLGVFFKRCLSCRSSCCKGQQPSCCKCQLSCCEGDHQPSCCGKGACGSCKSCIGAPSCPECSCGCVCSCPRCKGGCRCPSCGNPCGAGGCLC